MLTLRLDKEPPRERELRQPMFNAAGNMFWPNDDHWDYSIMLPFTGPATLKVERIREETGVPHIEELDLALPTAEIEALVAEALEIQYVPDEVYTPTIAPPLEFIKLQTRTKQ
jgi:hypothetical protein